ncbi:alpha/beta fold hydrolase [Paenibacillus sp. S-38]|uniref:alpha/beta fold hydrolase n=1 Tax=Paenibacillus sp. S-38 TaxID=3416710 RepID=UPI003CF63B20
MLWVHGWGMSPIIWPHNAEAGKGIHSVQPEDLLPGWSHSYFTYEGCRSAVQMLERLHRCLWDERPDAVVGWSLGGMQMLRCLVEELRSGRQRGGRMHGGMPLVILTGTSLRFIDSDRTYGWPRRIVERMRARVDAEPGAVAERFAEAMLTGTGYDQRLADQVKAAVRSTDFSPEGLHAGLSFLIQEDLRADWQALARPALQSGTMRLLWLQGQEDNICPVGAVPKEEEGWRKVILPGVGHLPFLERTPEFYQCIKEFLHGNLEYR